MERFAPTQTTKHKTHGIWPWLTLRSLAVDVYTALENQCHNKWHHIYDVWFIDLWSDCRINQHGPLKDQLTEVVSASGVACVCGAAGEYISHKFQDWWLIQGKCLVFLSDANLYVSLATTQRSVYTVLDHISLKGKKFFKYIWSAGARSRLGQVEHVQLVCSTCQCSPGLLFVFKGRYRGWWLVE